VIKKKEKQCENEEAFSATETAEKTFSSNEFTCLFVINTTI
jgi:hypothetical protein